MTQRIVNYKYGTGNPVLPDGSIDVRDGIDNLQSFDIFMNADEDTYNQRDGDIVKTLAGAVRAVGIQRIGDFTTGCTVTERNQGVLYETDGTVYVWLGALPKVVPAASSPATTGGISPSGDWLDIGDALLRSDLASPGGASLVGTAIRDSVSAYLSALDRLASRYATLQEAADAKKSIVVDIDYSLTDAVSVSDIVDISAVDDPVISVLANKIAFNISGVAKGVMRGLEFAGVATPTDTASSIAVNTQTALPVNYVTYEDIVASGLTMGLNLTKGRGNKVIGGKFGGMVYSPVTLGSAGGYGILLQGEKDVEISGGHFIATATDRHAVYTSRVVTDPVGTGNCEDVNIHDVTVDWLATNGTGDDSKLPFLARSPNGWRLHDFLSRGGSGLAKVGTENGSASNIEIYDGIALDMETRNNQFSAPISIGTAGFGYGVTHVRLAGLRTRIARGTAQPAARDCGGLFNGISQMRILDWNSTVDTGVMMSLTNCTDVLIDDIIDNVSGVNGPNAQPVIAFAGACSKFTVGKVAHNRADIAGKKALFGGLENVTDMTCNFTRAFKIGINGAGGYVLTDPWDLVASVTLGATNLTIQFKGHVTQQAVDESQYSMLSATHPNVYRSSTSGKAAVVGVLTFAGGAVNPNAATFTIEGILSK